MASKAGGYAAFLSTPITRGVAQGDKRKRVFTTAILSKGEKHSIALYCTGRKHAGENPEELLNQRREENDIPIQVCDGLSRNFPKSHATHVAKCNCHARRTFYDLHETWPKEVETVLDLYGEIFENDEQSPDERPRIGEVSFLYEATNALERDWRDAAAL